MQLPVPPPPPKELTMYAYIVAAVQSIAVLLLGMWGAWAGGGSPVPALAAATLTAGVSFAISSIVMVRAWEKASKTLTAGSNRMRVEANAQRKAIIEAVNAVPGLSLTDDGEGHYRVAVDRSRLLTATEDKEP